MQRLCATFVILILLGATGTLAPAQAQEGQRLASEAAKAHLQGKLDQALSLLGEALRDIKLSNDRRAIVLNDRGAVLARLNRPKEAIESFNQAVKLYPEYPAVYNNRGSTLLTIGLPREAIRDFDRAILLAPGYVAAFNNRAGAYIALKQYDRAIIDYTKAIKLTPTAVAALSGRGRAHLAADRPQTAMRDFSRALQLDARSALAYRNRAQAMTLSEQFAEAIADLSRAIAFEPANAAIYVERGRGYLATDDIASAIKDFSKALEIAPGDIDALEARAFAHIRVDAHAEAEADIQRALAIAPHAPVALAARAQLYLRTVQPDLAAREIARAMKLAKTRAEVLWVKGEIEEAAGQRSAAIDSYRAALVSNPALTSASAGLIRLGSSAAATGSAAPDALAIAGWRVENQGRRLLATNQDNPRIRIPLEPLGTGVPRLLAWEIQQPPHSKIGLLRFSAGTVNSPAGQQEAEQVAVIDLRAGKLLGIVPDRRGTTRAKWSWDDTRLVVASVDGLSDEFTLKGSRSRSQDGELAASTTRRRKSTEGRGYAPPDWIPWQGSSPPTRSRRASAPRRRSQPKSLFDVLFGN